ncbi:hypothetical protein MSMEI_6169 [Mycolicibacterium smegmatis MC2 155]|uniref:Uncharacterized protein n=2 Tax=Mycolicibacterium smegmatis (strain ATCC 700084 / mc(2)155) TaxID=246196 RepID=A0R5W4_MYCS2|nr:hypothetical protein MSMEG_6335 [Mycolicibacterium smegmatis MC2 155]AFP42598.1 hypothetical protein MSMEI_6169 [Mycolicibacterium smegmatis MC2 155]
MVLHGRDVRLATADTELPADVKAVGLQRLGVDLGDDLRLREIGRADPDGLEVTRDLAAAQGIRTASTGRQRREQGQHEQKDCQGSVLH